MRSCFEIEILPNDEIISKCEVCITDKQTYRLTDAYLELVEKAKAKTLNVSLDRKYIDNPEVITVRRKRVDLYLLHARIVMQSHEKIRLYKTAVTLLKKLRDSESERTVVRNELSEIQKTFITEMQSYPYKFDISKQIDYIHSSVNAILPTEYLYYLITALPVLKKDDVKMKLWNLTENLFLNTFSLQLKWTKGERLMPLFLL